MATNQKGLKKNKQTSEEIPQECLYFKTVDLPLNYHNEFSTPLYEIITKKEFESADKNN